MVKSVMRHLLGYDNNPHAGLGDQAADIERSSEECLHITVRIRRGVI